MSRKNSVLITGAAGFIGSNLVDALLQRDYKVIGVDNLSFGTIDNVKHNFDNANFSFYEFDIIDLPKLKEITRKVNIICHLAALKIPKYGKAIDTLLVNTKGTENVLKTACENKAKFIFASSSDVYGKNSNVPLKEEDDLVLGSTKIKRWSYASSKIFDEQLIFAFAAEYDFPVVILRPFNSYGRRNDLTWRGGPQSLFIDAVLKNRPVEIHGDGSQTRSFTYISDTIDGIVKAIENEKTVGKVLNIGNDKTETSIKNLALLIKRLSKTKQKLKVNYIPHNELFGQYEEIMRRVPDITKARKILGFEPKISLEEGLSMTIEWQKKNVLVAKKY